MNRPPYDGPEWFNDVIGCISWIFLGIFIGTEIFVMGVLALVGFGGIV